MYWSAVPCAEAEGNRAATAVWEGSLAGACELPGGAGTGQDHKVTPVQNPRTSW